ncbi:MAG: ABC transporter substrate-binding protein, partial [Pseudomonadota bacterium]|nr:ABC transporter substrate-binding protein [Pseudomonadota bacterium]
PTSVGLIARQMKAQGARFQVIGGDAIMTNQFWAITGSDGEGVLMSYSPDQRNRSEARSVVAAMQKNGIEPEGYTLNTYAAVQAIAVGIKRAGKDPAKVAGALRSSPVSTVIGPLTFDAKGDIAGTNFVIYRWHNGTYAETDQ